MALDRNSLEVLLEAIGGDRPSLAVLIESFEETGPALMAAMKDAVNRPDLEALRRAAHTLKSSARDFGALELSQLCATLESQCKANDMSEAPSLIGEIEPQFKAAMAELAEIKKDYL